jgi:hypothetical protein
MTKKLTNVAPPIIPAIAVDEYAQLLATIEPLQARADYLKASLKALGQERVEGTIVDAVISLSEPTYPDRKKLEAHFGLEAFKAEWCYKSLSVTLKLTGKLVH